MKFNPVHSMMLTHFLGTISLSLLLSTVSTGDLSHFKWHLIVLFGIFSCQWWTVLKCITFLSSYFVNVKISYAYSRTANTQVNIEVAPQSLGLAEPAQTTPNPPNGGGLTGVIGPHHGVKRPIGSEMPCYYYVGVKEWCHSRKGYKWPVETLR